MNFGKQCSIFCLSLFVLIITTPAQAVIILESTYKKSGFKLAESLALAPQFSSLMLLEGDDEDSSSGSGSWIGNYKDHGYVLTAAHMFEDGMQASDYTYSTLDGTEYKGSEVFIHPLWNGNFDERTGYDLAIVRLDEEVADVGPQPALYDGTEEEGNILTFIGYGCRGMGKKGEDTSIDTGDRPAAAEGLVEYIEEAIQPVPKKSESGNYFGVWLPKEDGSLPNPYDDEGSTKPVSPLAGLLGEGDSGGPAWIETKNGWVIAGVNSAGSGNAEYGEESYFIRISYLHDWIKEIMPTAKFRE
jgi:hypothetical protein